MMHLHPFRARQDSWLLAGQVNSRFFAQSHDLTHSANRLNPGGVAELIEERVARNLDRVGQPDGAVPSAFFGNPAFEVMVAVTDAAAAIEAGGGQLLPQSG